MDIEQLAGTKPGNYEIENHLDMGGRGVAYKARQISLDRPLVSNVCEEIPKGSQGRGKPRPSGLRTGT